MPFTTSDGETFAEQNTHFAADLTPEDHAAIDLYADHHAGGLYVLIRRLSPTLLVKAHDTWGPGMPDEPGEIVVHVYDPEEDDEVEEITYFTSGREALRAFLAAKAPTV